jgi:sorting nexin-1/2
MQLDAEEDENVFYKPPVEPAARAPAESAETAADSQAAAVVTAEDDDDDD